jgi:[ribosomal protein S18]-alanine N-acetyltransferase
MAITIETMTLRHVDDVLVIEQAAAPHPWTRGIFTDELTHGDTRTYRIALAGSKVVGFAGVLTQVGEAHITNVAVVNEWRRFGIASRLLVNVLQTAVERGALAATLEVRSSNIGAQRMYHRFGFVPAGVRPKYYQDGENAVIMWADDIRDGAYRDRLLAIEQAALSRSVAVSS